MNRAVSAIGIPVTIALCLLTGCSSTIVVGDLECAPAALSAISSHNVQASGTVSAQLAQMTIRSPKLTRRFNLEIYHRNDTTVFYSGGFVGKGSFKGRLADSSLVLLLFGNKQYYIGALSGLVRPDLSRYGYVVKRVRDILAGQLYCVDPEDRGIWRSEYRLQNGRVRGGTYTSNRDSIRVELDLYRLKDDFPFYQLEELKVQNKEDGSSVKLKFIEQKFGPVPEVKFRIPDVSGWDRIDYIELD